MVAKAREITDRAEELVGSTEEFCSFLRKASQAYPEGAAEFRENIDRESDIPVESYDRWLLSSSKPHPAVCKSVSEYVRKVFQPCL